MTGAGCTRERLLAGIRRCGSFGRNNEAIGSRYFRMLERSYWNSSTCREEIQWLMAIEQLRRTYQHGRCPICGKVVHIHECSECGSWQLSSRNLSIAD